MQKKDLTNLSWDRCDWFWRRKMRVCTSDVQLSMQTWWCLGEEKDDEPLELEQAMLPEKRDEEPQKKA